MGHVTIVEDKDYGPSIKGRWVPAPRYVLRRDRLMKIFRQLTPGTLLETGPGAGALLRELSKLGFQCSGYDTSTEARAVASAMLTGIEGVDIYHEPTSELMGQFDYLLSCEVLEHIEDDKAALQEWLSFLKPGGVIVAAVPAHQKKFGPLDDWAGHLRRYDRDEFVSLFESAGVKVEKVECYGYPLANWTSSIRNFLLKKKEAQKNKLDRNAAADTAKSGVDRTQESKLFMFQTSFLGRMVMQMFCRIQERHIASSNGDGWILVGTKQQ